MKRIVLNGTEWTTKELFEKCDNLDSWGVRLSRPKTDPAYGLSYEGIQLNRFKDHQQNGGNYYYRLRYNNLQYGCWRKVTLSRIIPVLERMSQHGFLLSY